MIKNIYILLLLSLLTPGWGQSIEIPQVCITEDSTTTVPIFIDGAFSDGDGGSNEKTDTMQISIGMRRILNYYIQWLYW